MRAVGARHGSRFLAALLVRGLLLAGATTCAAPQRATSETPRRGASAAPACPTAVADAPIVVVVLDGARWQDVYRGLDGDGEGAAVMPKLHAWIARRGVALGVPGHGDEVRASGPNYVSLPGYTELFTGLPPVACQSNDCARTALPTIADDVRACTGEASDVAIFASWPEIERAATQRPDRIVVSTGRSVHTGDDALRHDPRRAALLDEARDASPWPGGGDFRPDRYTAAIALAYLEAERPRFLFLGLGEPDELAHLGDRDGYLRALHAADDTIDALERTLDRMGERGRRTTVFLTSDHGRADDFRDHGGAYPESSRVWLVALGSDLAARGVEGARAPHHLADLAPTLRARLGLPGSLDPRAGAPIPELLAGAPPL